MSKRLPSCRTVGRCLLRVIGAGCSLFAIFALLADNNVDFHVRGVCAVIFGLPGVLILLLASKMRNAKLNPHGHPNASPLTLEKDWELGTVIRISPETVSKKLAA